MPEEVSNYLSTEYGVVNSLNNTSASWLSVAQQCFVPGKPSDPFYRRLHIGVSKGLFRFVGQYSLCRT